MPPPPAQLIEQTRMEMLNAWKEAELRKSFAVSDRSPQAARTAVSVLAADLPDELVGIARLLVIELVSNSVRHRPSTPGAKIGPYARFLRLGLWPAGVSVRWPRCAIGSD